MCSDAGPSADVLALRATERRTQRELAEARDREYGLVLRLALSKREADARAAAEAAPAPSDDPQAEIARLRREVEAARVREQELCEELQAVQFQPGSVTGKKLVQKCRELQAENEQLGRDLSQGEVHRLKVEAELQHEYAAELKKRLSTTRGMVEDMTDELEASQALVASLRKELSPSSASATTAPPAERTPRAEAT